MHSSQHGKCLDDLAPLNAIVSQSPGLVCVLEADCRFRAVSPELCAVLDRREQDLIGLMWADLVEDDGGCSPGDAGHGESRTRSDVSGPRWLKWSTRRLESGGQLCVAQEVTATKHVMHRVATVLSVMRALAVGHDARSIPRVIEAICEADGWTGGELWWAHERDAMTCAGAWPSPIATTASNVVPSDGPIGAVWANGQAWIGPHETETVAAIPILDGQVVLGVLVLHGDSPREDEVEPTLEALRYVAFQLGHVVKRWGLAPPISERRPQTWSGPALSDVGVRSVLSRASMVVFTLDDEARVAAVAGDDELAARLGLDNSADDVFDRCRRSPELCHACRCALAGEEHRATFAIGDDHYYARLVPARDGSGAVTGVFGTVFDMTATDIADPDHATEPVRTIAANRLVALGSLAGGVANEINNAMTIVRLSLGRLTSYELSRQPMTPSRLHRVELLQDAREGVARVERITQELRTFATHEAGTNHAPIDVRDIVDRVIRMTHPEVRHRARVVCEHGEVPMVWATEGAVLQVFLNLVMHAAHAVCAGASHRNEIRIATSTDTYGRAVVTIRDDGLGFSPEQLDRIFEPSFHSGRWTGLGMSICRDTVIAFGGEITVASEPESGTTVRVVLPRCDRQAVVTDDIEDLRTGPVERADRSTGRVLIVDDDRPVAAAVALALEDCDVVVAGSGREALKILRCDQNFDVVLCDLMMPEISGMDLFEAIAAEMPTLAARFIFMTGGTFTERASSFLRTVPNERAHKPFSAEDLREMVRCRSASVDVPNTVTPRRGRTCGLQAPIPRS